MPRSQCTTIPGHSLSLSRGFGVSPGSAVYFVPVVCFVLFNVADLVGKTMAQALKWPGPSKLGQAVLLTISLARLALIPLLMFCNVSPHNRNTEVRERSPGNTSAG